MQLCAVIVVDNGIYAVLLGDLDVAHHNTLQTELPANEFLDQRRSLFRKVLLDAAIAAAKEALGDKLTGNIVKEIYVPGRIVNIVAK